MTSADAPTTYGAWCVAQGVTHAHCPCRCEHPQPFLTSTLVLLCGACWVLGQALCIMEPCGPGTCREE